MAVEQKEESMHTGKACCGSVGEEGECQSPQKHNRSSEEAKNAAGADIEHLIYEVAQPCSDFSC